MVSKLARYCLPRYHFSSSEEQFFEREPYRNHILMQEQPKLVTRFISVASIGNEKKEKQLYGFKIIPSKFLGKNQINEQPTDSTDNPYALIDFDQIILANRPNIKQENNSFFFDNKDDQQRRRNNKFQGNNNKNYNQYNQYNANNNKRSNTSNQDDADKRLKSNENSCWFCLSSPEVEKYLIVSIGDHAYLAHPKGPLTSHHLLILPIGHYKSLVEIELKPSQKDAYDEIGKFKNAVIDYFQTQNLNTVFFERNFKSGHLQLEAVGIPKRKIDNLREVLMRECQSKHYTLNEIPNNDKFSDRINDKASYFYIEFLGERYFIGIKVKLGFPIQFGRIILADENVLNCPSKVDWRTCEKGQEEAKGIVSKIREEFKPFDFT